MTACILIFLLAACSSLPPSSSEVEFNRSEAVKARINLALAYLEQNDFPKAKQNIDKALAHDEKDYLPYSVLAYYYQQTGDAENAEKAYQTALKLSQNRPDVLNNYGTFYVNRVNFNRLISNLSRLSKAKHPTITKRIA